MKKLNVLMLTPDYPPNLYGGIGTHVYELVQSLVKFNCSVTIIVARFDAFIKNEFIEEYNGSIRVIRFNEDTKIREIFRKEKISNSTNKWTKNNAELILPVIDVIQDETYDIIHAHDYYFSVVIDALKRKYKIPVITTIHSMNSPPSFLEESIRRYICINSDVVISVSDSLKQEIIERYGEYCSKIVVIPNGVNIRSLGKSLEHALEIKPKSKYITFCGRLSANKGCDILLRSFSLFLSSISAQEEYKLLVIGNGPLFDDLNQLANELDLEKSIEFYGYREPNEVRDILSKSLIHIVPSTYEPFGLVTLEAMAEGTCVIASEVGGIVEVIQNGYNGKLVPPNDKNALCNAITELINNPEKRINYAYNGLKTALEFNWDIIAKQTIELYNHTLTSTMA